MTSIDHSAGSALALSNDPKKLYIQILQKYKDTSYSEIIPNNLEDLELIELQYINDKVRKAIKKRTMKTFIIYDSK
jgi:hypothetical protein